MADNKPKPRNGSRPIRRTDSAVQFPNRLTYPNGTYASQGSNGASGAFGAMLPTLPSNPVRTLGMQVQGGTLPNGQRINFGAGAGNNPYKVGAAVGTSFQTPTTNGFQTNASSYNPIAVNGFQTPTTNGFQTTQSSYQPAPQPVILSGEVVPITTMREAIAAGATVARPSGVFTGDMTDPNNIAWVNYWNAQAIKPDKKAPRVLSKDQIWNMKAEQRRRNAGTGNGDTGSTATQTTYQPFFSRAVTFRV